MKRLLITLVGLLLPFLAFSQEHISFKGVPIDGTLSSYVAKMQSKGFKYLGKADNGVAIMSGDFAGFKGCTLGVNTLDNLDVVSRIAVVFPVRDNWAGLYSDYFSLKEMLMEKYGAPADVLEKFQSSYVGDDNQKMHEVKMDRCDYYSTFDLELGQIHLEIISSDMTCCVRLLYFDKANSQKVRQAAMEDL